MSPLFEAQAAMKRALFGEDRGGMLQQIAGDRGAASDRLAIYERMYLARLVASMEEDFPALQRVAGDLFQRLAVTHVRRRPPGMLPWRGWGMASTRPWRSWGWSPRPRSPAWSKRATAPSGPQTALL